MAAASRHLTPVTLELGGKSPCIVERQAHLDLAARRIAWGKFLNAGQTCIAPDYLLVQESAREELLGRLRFWIQRFFGEEPARSPDYARIINRKHVQRLARLMGSGRVVCGGVIKEDERYVAPTILSGVSWEDPVMQEEIFGPLLPVLSFGELSEAIAAVNRRPKPLALYFFSDNRAHQRRVLREVSFGGGCINETLSHIVTPHLPFGGVGESGLGRYHGRASFDTFSHYKSVLRKSNLLDLGLRYPPYRDKLRWVKRIWK
jgi:aldehyde dehydrogenase (NAD+)